MNAKLVEQFGKPGSMYRGAPFWAWNGKLEPDELRRQVRLMHRMGLGGFFMHSRVGLATPYLSGEWFECVNACIDEAEKLDMQAWLYDEDRWPSGAAGGLVTKNPKFRMRTLVMEERPDISGFRWDSSTVAAFTARVDGARAGGLTRIAKGRKPRGLKRGERLLVFRVEAHAPSDWYNGQTYLDTMNPAAVREFIKVTHEAYRGNIGKHFGKRVPGIFTDEPNYGGVCRNAGSNKWTTPWTGALPAVFRKRYGYPIEQHICELFFDVDGADMSRARYHYCDCITHLFVRSFAKQIGAWCGRNNMLHTGHVLAEPTPSSQTSLVGSAMRFYEHMQAPGIDILTEHRREYDTAKQVASVARQFGRKWRLSETYGCTGWDFPFAGHKAVSDWQVALGINLRCQHLAWYTMEGQAKRDYPAGIFYQSPWWELYPKVEDYFARVHFMMTRGEEVRDLLVVHPVESMWTIVKKDWRNDPRMEDMDRRHMRLRDMLLSAHLDFDYGEEDILARHGRLRWETSPRRGRVAGAARRPVVRVGKARYKAVLVPALRTIRSSTLRLLAAFRAAGGLVVFVGAPPRHVDAVESPAALRLAGKCRVVAGIGPEVVKAVDRSARRVSITGPAGGEIISALYMLREDRDMFYIFVCNSGHRAGELRPEPNDKTMARNRRAGHPDVRIRGFAGCSGAPLEFDPETGRVWRADAQQARGAWEIRTSLPPLGSRLFVVPKRKTALKAARREQIRNRRIQPVRRAKWSVLLSEHNCAVLDRPSYRIGAGPWQGPEEILRVDNAARDALGVKRRGGEMLQPWARPPAPGAKRTRVSLRYRFEVRAVPDGSAFLGLERPETFKIALNGAAVSADSECGWWCDRSLRTVPIDPGLWRPGMNELVLECDYSEDHPGLEIVYLLGNFGVKVSGTQIILTGKPESLRLGNWVRQGLPFYAGSVRYCCRINPKLKKGERLFVNVPAYRGTAVRVLADSRPAGVIAWEPNEVEITRFAGKGFVELAIEIIGHRRNSHGPLHMAQKWPHWTGPAEFATSGDKWVDGYQLVPCGMMKPPRLIVRA